MIPSLQPVRALGLDLAAHRETLRSFLKEDLGRGDLTTVAVVPGDPTVSARLVPKSRMVLAGLELFFEIFRLLDEQAALEAQRRDGDRIEPGEECARLRARARALLSGERVALNLLQRLSGIATLTRTYVEAVSGTPAHILDTRKTTPGLRVFEKYAVVAGGGVNHRLGLDDAILIKENHIRLAGGIRPALLAARASRGTARFIEVEVQSLEELDEALEPAPDVILLDNMTPELVRTAIARVRARNREILLEASGTITLDNVRRYAEAGVDWISVGALTHSAPAADLSLEIE